MDLTTPQLRNLRISLRLIAFGIGAGLFFVILADGVGDIYPLTNGAIIGFLIAVAASVFELYIYEKSIRKQRFIIVFLTRSLFYLILILTIIVLETGIARMIKEDLDFRGLMQNEPYNQYLLGGKFIAAVFYTFALVVIINFTRQISRKLGHGVMISLITGKNYYPKEHEKIFMFLNIPDSDRIVDQIGRMNFHRFINEIVYDITPPILSNYGIIYQYVEDEMVVNWSMKEGIRNAYCIRCYFDIIDKLYEQREKYVKLYGITPIFNAALHCGTVVKGEIGFIRTEIVYHGDVLNTTSRILETCKRHKNEMLISSQLLDWINLPVIYRSKKCGDITLRGKKEPMELFTIEEIDVKLIAFN
jgi:adenylate cyclase